MQFVEESRVMLAVILCSSLSMQRRSVNILTVLFSLLAVVVRLAVAMELVLVLRRSSS